MCHGGETGVCNISVPKDRHSANIHGPIDFLITFISCAQSQTIGNRISKLSLEANKSKGHP
jgi:hypothetical protein